MNHQRRFVWRTGATGMIVVFAAAVGCERPDAETEVEAGTETPTDARAEPGTQSRALAPGADGQGFPADFDPCELVSREEAASASGQAVGTPQAEVHAILATCAYPGQDAIMPATILEIRPDAAMYQTARDMLDGGPNPIDDLDGIGDRAFYVRISGYHTVTVAASGRFAAVSVAPDDSADNKQKAVELARRVAERL